MVHFSSRASGGRRRCGRASLDKMVSVVVLHRIPRYCTSIATDATPNCDAGGASLGETFRVTNRCQPPYRRCISLETAIRKFFGRKQLYRRIRWAIGDRAVW